MTKLETDSLKKMALGMCMSSGFRYLECLHAVVTFFGESVEDEFAAEVKKDFADYYEKMTKAGLPVNQARITLTELEDEQSNSGA